MRDNNGFETGTRRAIAGKRVFGVVSTGFLTLALLGIGASLSGCSSNPQAANSSAPPAQISSSALEEKIKSSFNTDPQLKASNLDVRASADRNEVMLSGTVESETVKTRAVETAKSAQVGLTVTSKIDVDPGCCGAGAMGGHGPGEAMKGMKGMNGTPGAEHKPR